MATKYMDTTRRSFIAAAAVASMASGFGAPRAVFAADGQYVPGTYTGVGAGRNGDITVEVSVDETSILSVEVVSHQETPGISDPAFAQVPEAILEAQSPDVDLASGASLSSKGIMAAVSDALGQARGIERLAEERLLAADVVVIGAGAAGLAAACAAAENGKSVIVLEAAGSAGGATLASSGFFLRMDDEYDAGLERNDEEAASYKEIDASGMPEPWVDDWAALQEQLDAYLGDAGAAGRFDSVECALVDHYLRGAGTDRDGNAVALDYKNLRASFVANADILAWLAEDGFVLTDEWVKSRSPKGGKISHVLKPEGGSAALINALLTKAERLGCDVQYSVRAKGLVMQGGAVSGVRAVSGDGSEIVYEAPAVVIATGAFSSNAALVSAYQTAGGGLSADCGSTNPPTNRGDGLIMAQRSGARSRDLQFMATMVRPFHVAGTTADSNAALAAAQLAVNSAAARFADDGDASAVQKAMLEQKDGVAYLVGDAAMSAALEGNSQGSVEAYAAAGWLFQADTLQGLAEEAGLDADALVQTVTDFNEVQASGSDEAFGRAEFNGPVEQAPFTLAKIQVCYHLTFGGLVIDDGSRVLDAAGVPIEGLYAAGSVLSGFEGAAHQTGDCLNYVVYTGRVAGQTA